MALFHPLCDEVKVVRAALHETGMGEFAEFVNCHMIGDRHVPIMPNIITLIMTDHQAALWNKATLLAHQVHDTDAVITDQPPFEGAWADTPTGIEAVFCPSCYHILLDDVDGESV